MIKYLKDRYTGVFLLYDDSTKNYLPSGFYLDWLELCYYYLIDEMDRPIASEYAKLAFIGELYPVSNCWYSGDREINKFKNAHYQSDVPKIFEYLNNYKFLISSNYGFYKKFHSLTEAWESFSLSLLICLN
jgi:hypothetical protein